MGADIEARRAKTDVQLLLRTRYAELGRMTGHEYAVLALFLLLVLLWLTRSPGRWWSQPAEISAVLLKNFGRIF
jgi:di/tricarboxylate transporter